MHEMGHVLGLDSDAAGDSVMHVTLDAGQRRVSLSPEWGPNGTTGVASVTEVSGTTSVKVEEDVNGIPVGDVAWELIPVAAEFSNLASRKVADLAPAAAPDDSLVLVPENRDPSGAVNEPKPSVGETGPVDDLGLGDDPLGGQHGV
jgi:hypothetical protein